MKKYLLLTSVFALAACGGGGGGHSGSGITPGPVTRAAVSNAAVESNGHVTSMASEILVQNGTGAIEVRSGSVNKDGKTYTSYRLDDVTFRFAGEDSIIKFDLDDEGRIISAGKYDKSGANYVLSEEGTFVRAASDSNEFGSAKTLYGWQQTLTTNNTALVAAIADALDGKTLPDGKNVADFSAELAGYIANQFEDPVEIQSDNQNIDVGAALADEVAEEINSWAASQSTPGWAGSAWLNAVVAAATEYYQDLIPDTFGDPQQYSAKLNVKGANIGLRYADLGFAELQVAEKNNAEHIVERTFSPYAGGYDNLERNVTESTEFTGTALAGIEHKDTNGDKDAVLVRQDNAKLTLNVDGSSSLVMNNLARVENDGKTAHSEGGHWYTLVVEKGANGTPTFTVSGTNTIAGYNLLNVPAEAVAFTSDEFNATEHEYVRTDTDNNVRYGGFVENHVYGTSASDIEAVSQFGFSNENTNTHEEVAIYGAFGGKPTPTE